jgi:predicted nucleic acid-binding protein
MATAQTSNPPSVVIDANVVIAFCAKEPGGYAKAKAELESYAKAGWRFYAPGVLAAEALFVLCK